MSKELAKTYDPKQIEEKLYERWCENKYFHAEVDRSKKPFTTVMPPPNITGKLHMGHALDNTLQDILIRYKRMEGYNALWIPGTDHAAISTEVKVTNQLKEEGIDKKELGREGFLERTWQWKEEYGGTITSQLKKMGVSCDWDRERFTMDEGCSKAVEEVFINLYNKGYIYKGSRIINWCPVCKTSLSDAEVEHEEQDGFFWHIKYPIVGTDRFLEIATTRPETLLGDTAIAVHPDDERYKDIVGKMAILPLVNREIPIVADYYVDKEFGTGAVKITPAHDPNDFEVGKRHNLPEINIMNDDATINEKGGKYAGMDRYEARKAIVADLDEQGYLVKVVPHMHAVGTHDRCGTTVEPLIKQQWFVKMDELAKPAINALKTGELRFVPERFDKIYLHWLENIKDWCISRQLWWGHRIPAYYLPSGGYVVAETEQEALALAREKSGNPALQFSDLKQDEDALDTWFSSWLWPISLFNGILDPDNEEFKYYYPTSVLVTGPDIIFFWVARMIMAGYEYTGKFPFKDVYFTGIVRDKLGRKMSKSLGNSPDPLDLIDKYGADGVRMGMMLSAPAGNDILFDESLCEQGRNFCNKIWNAFRLVQGWTVSETLPQNDVAALAINWFGAQMRSSAAVIADHFSKYRLSDALMEVYHLFWDEFSAWFLELVKPAYGQAIDAATYQATLSFFNDLLHVLHPFMPFITEELWQNISERRDGESIMTSPQTIQAPLDADKRQIEKFAAVKQVITNIRGIRSSKNISPKEPLVLQVIGENPVEAYNCIISKLANISEIAAVTVKGEGASTFMVGTSEYALLLGNLIDAEAEITKAQAELKHLEGFLAGVEKKLGNKRFVEGAPAAVVELERKKKADAETKIAVLKETLKSLGA